MPVLRSLACLLLLSPCVLAADLNTLKGKKVSGELVSADEKAIIIKTAAGDVATPLPEAMQLVLQTPTAKMPEKYTDVELIDGTMFHCSAFTLRGKQVELSVLPNMKLSLPMSAVAYILTNAQDPKTQREWQEIIADRGKRDRFFVLKEGRLDGLEGTFGDADATGKEIHFDLAGAATSRKLPIDRLVALLFNNRLVGNIPPTICRVADSHKNLIIANKSILSGGKLTLTTVAGIKVEYATLETVAVLDYSQDKVVFLSDLKCREENIFDESIVQYTRDRNLDNQPIQLEGVPYAKGLVVHAGMVLTFDIGGDFKEFKALLGFDQSAGLVSNVNVKFEGDGRPLYTAEVKVKDKPQPLTLDVKKIKQLKITVSAAEGLFIGRQVTLADAKISK